jgi:hypothetical protein
MVEEEVEVEEVPLDVGVGEVEVEVVVVVVVVVVVGTKIRIVRKERWDRARTIWKYPVKRTTTMTILRLY